MPQRLHRNLILVLLAVVVAATTSGCYSPFAADRGALMGGVTGAGVGALVGNAVGNTAAGALIGGGVGAVTGGAIGQGLDEVDARNRAANAALAAQINQPPQGAVSIDDVIAMTKAGVNEELIAGQIRSRGVMRPLSSQDIIVLQQQGVSPQAIQAMQATPVPGPRMMGPPPMGPPGPYYGPPYVYPYPPPPPPYYYYPPPAVVGWRFNFR